MDKTLYVKITKYPSSSESWYNDEYLMNAIFEVVPCDETAARWIVKADLVKGASRSIRKSDCEVVPTLQPETEQDLPEPRGVLEIVAHRDATEYAKANYTSSTIQRVAKKAFLEGHQVAKEKYFMQQVVPEGQHLISTEQLKELEDCYKRGNADIAQEYLTKWFPTVFVPAKTYQIGQRFSRINRNIEDPENYILASADVNKALLVCLENGFRYGDAIQVSDLDNITLEEMNKFSIPRPFDKEFTLLPDTTDQMV